MRPHVILGLPTLVLTVLAIPTNDSRAAVAAPAALVAQVDVPSVLAADVPDWPAPDPFEGLPAGGPEMGPQDVPVDATEPVPHEPVAEPVPVAWVQAGPPSMTENDAIANARSLLGVPYLWGGNSTAGMDCSAYVSRAWGGAAPDDRHALPRRLADWEGGSSPG
jgi:cell wall-associated NlpC family hydrolase